MDKQRRQQLLSELAKMPQGRALREFLDEELLKIGDVGNVKNEAELIGAQLAKKLVKKLFSFMADKPTPGKKTGYA